MIKITIVTQWVAPSGERTEAEPYADCFHPKLIEEYNILKYTDITGQDAVNILPEPNLYVIEAIVNQATFSLIDIDTNYEILSSEEV